MCFNELYNDLFWQRISPKILQLFGTLNVVTSHMTMWSITLVVTSQTFEGHPLLFKFKERVSKKGFGYS